MKTKNHILPFILISFLSLLSLKAHALAEGTYQVIIRKQQEKQASRWSLLDWMNTKKKMAIMDQWLALNSSVNHFEFSLYGEKNKTDMANIKNDGISAGLSFYYRIFGLEGSWSEIEKTLHEKSGRVGLRIFGKSDQGPNIKLFYGLASQKDFSQNLESIKPSFYGGSTTIYLLPFLGGFVEYAKYGKETFSQTSTEVDGDRLTSGAFIELSFLRIYGSLEKRRFHYNTSGVESDRHIKSTNLGVKLFF